MVRFDQGIPRHLSLGEQRKRRSLRMHKRKRPDFHERRLHEYKPKKQFQADIHAEKCKFKSSEKLQKAAQKLLIQTMTGLNIPVKGKKLFIPVKGKKLFAAVLKAQLGKRFYREKRRDKLRILATGCAVYHELAAQLNPKKALEQLAASVGLDTERISDPCRVIVESLIDYGGSKDEKTANRQYAARMPEP
jgi:pimeloyl-CoA synthetase